jgi:flagellar basal-body rod protein FlgF
MENSLLIGLSRQVALQRELDIIANNIANLNTTGFKATGSKFEEFLMPVAREFDLTDTGRQLSFVIDRGTWHDLSQGAIELTGNPLDVALDGDGFLVVQTPNGERYTRNGSLRMNAAGELVTAEGFPVLGESGRIVFQLNDVDITIARDGTVTVRDGIRGRLRLVGFAAPQALRKDTASTYAAPAGLVPEPVVNTRVIQGALEKSNVKSVAELTRMIEVSRAYTSLADMLRQHSDLRRSAIERLAEMPS